MSDQIGVIICYSRCLYCGRRTPHECCHEHSEEKNPGWWDDLQENVGADVDPMDLIWRTGRDKEPEVCEDGACPVWGTGEWEHKQKWASMTKEERQAETDRLNREIQERRAARRAAREG